MPLGHDHTVQFLNFARGRNDKNFNLMFRRGRDGRCKVRPDARLCLKCRSQNQVGASHLAYSRALQVATAQNVLGMSHDELMSFIEVFNQPMTVLPPEFQVTSW